MRKFAMLPGGTAPGLAGTPKPPAQFAPATSPPPAFAAPPAPPPPPAAGGLQGIKDKAKSLSDTVGGIGSGIGRWATDRWNAGKWNVGKAVASQTPPLARMFPETFAPGTTLGSIAGKAQKFLAGKPEMTAGLLGGLAPGLVNGVLGMGGGLGLAGLAGVHGVLSGGESALAAKNLFGPALGKLGLA